jgi:hypothetical protein
MTYNRRDLGNQLEKLGKARAKDGDRLEWNGVGYSYMTGTVLTHIYIMLPSQLSRTEDDDHYRIEVACCALAGLNPTLDLFRRVAGWRTTARIAAPYVVFDDSNDLTAVLCQWTIDSSELDDNPTGRKLIRNRIDILGDLAGRIRKDLSDLGGYVLEQEKGRGMASMGKELVHWWAMEDGHVSQLLPH